MTIVTGLAVILIAGNSLVFRVHLPLGMAAKAIKYGKIVWIWMTIRTLVPFPLVAPAVYREVLVVMVKS